MRAFDPAAPQPLDAADRELIAVAQATLLRVYKPFWRTVAAAIRSRDGRIWTGVHLGATVGRMSVCAEPVALGRAILEGDGTMVVGVAVRHPKPEESDGPPAVVSPCGACRELVLDHAPEALIIVPDNGGLAKWPVRALLRLPYQR